MALWLGEAGGAGGEGSRFDLNPVTVWVMRQLLGHPRLRRSGGSRGRSGAGGLRQEEAELGGLQGPGAGSSPLPRLCVLLRLFARSLPIILSSRGLWVRGVGIGAVRVAFSGGVWLGGAGVSWSRAWVRQWFRVVLTGGVKNLWLQTKHRVTFYRREAADARTLRSAPTGRRTEI